MSQNQVPSPDQEQPESDPISNPALTAAQIQQHPEFKRLDWEWKFTPTQSGKVSVARGRRGGPFDLYYEVHGRGDVKIVWIMGLGAFCNAWKRQTKYFGIDRATTYSSLVFDNRGMGRSAKPVCRYSTSEMALDTLDLLRHLGWVPEIGTVEEKEPPVRNLHVVGVSMGGMIAQEVAQLIPERVASLCLVSTGPRIIRTAPFLETLSQRVNMFVPQNKDIDTQIAEVAHRLFSDKFLADPDTEGVFGSNFERFMAGELEKRNDTVGFTRWGFTMQAIAAGWHWKGQKELSVLAERTGRSRIAVFHGDRDRMLSFKGGDVLREELDKDKGEGEEGVQWSVWKGAGHVLCWEKEVEFNEAVENLVGRCERMEGR